MIAAPVRKAPVVAMDDMPIGGGKKAQPSEFPEDEEKPIPRGAYNLDALGDDAFGGPPPGGNPPKKAVPSRFA